MPTWPLVSVVVPVRNGAELLERAVGSVLRQSVSDLEVLVVDDGSDDDTAAVLEHLARSDSRIRRLRTVEGRSGTAGRARNVALDHARGDWVVAVDADDEIAQRRIETMLAVASRSGRALVFDNLTVVRGTCERTYIRQDLGDRLTFEQFVASHAPASGLPNLGYLKPMWYRRSGRGLDVRYDEALAVGEDLILALDLLTAGPAAWYGQPMYRYTKGRGTASNRPAAAALEAFAQALRGACQGRLDPAVEAGVAFVERQAARSALAERATAGRGREVVAELAARPDLIGPVAVSVAARMARALVRG